MNMIKRTIGRLLIWIGSKAMPKDAWGTRHVDDLTADEWRELLQTSEEK